MALKHVKPNAAGAAHRGRYVTRVEAKDGARQARRVEDRVSYEVLAEEHRELLAELKAARLRDPFEDGGLGDMRAEALIYRIENK